MCELPGGATPMLIARDGAAEGNPSTTHPGAAQTIQSLCLF